jgi:GrpB-like predicted nucleotidyltransferase (UPF0157 family)
MKSRFDELLPFYVNGTLTEADRTWVEDYLREHPRANSELAWYRSLQARLRSDVPAVSSEIGLERAMQRIRSDSAQTQPARRAASSSLQRLADWLRAALPQPMLRPALVGAAAVVAVQTVAIVQLMNQRDDELSQVRALQVGNVAEKGPYLKLNFKPDARESDIRMLLIQSNGTLAAGPGQLGDYYVRVPTAQVAALADTLKANPIVDGVAVVDALPARP